MGVGLAQDEVTGWSIPPENSNTQINVAAVVQTLFCILAGEERLCRVRLP